jgi:hypothetical protein
MKKIKEEDLILYIYHECTPRLKAAIEQELEENITLRDRLETLRRTTRQLEKLKLGSPSKQSVKAILKYAQEAARKK